MAGLAQMVERFTCNEDVVGSIPTTGSNFYLKSYKEKKMKLESAGEGLWKDKDGKTVARTVDDKLVPVSKEYYNRTYYSHYLENIDEVYSKVPPSMTEVDLIILRPCENAREHVFNGMRKFETKSGGIKEIFNKSQWPNEVVNAYTINSRGKVVRVWRNKNGHIKPSGDKVSESVYFDQIRLNTITPEIYDSSCRRGVVKVTSTGRHHSGVRTPLYLRKH